MGALDNSRKTGQRRTAEERIAMALSVQKEKAKKAAEESPSSGIEIEMMEIRPRNGV